MFGFLTTRGISCLTEELLAFRDLAAFSEFGRVCCYAEVP